MAVKKEWILEDKTKAVTRLHHNYAIYRYLINYKFILPVVLSTRSMTLQLIIGVVLHKNLRLYSV